MRSERKSAVERLQLTLEPVLEGLTGGTRLWGASRPAVPPPTPTPAPRPEAPLPSEPLSLDGAALAGSRSAKVVLVDVDRPRLAERHRDT
jgi:hypothetical protein